MKNLHRLLLVATALPVLHLCAAAPKSYQLSGQIVAIDENIIVIQKGESKFEVSRKTKTKGVEKAKVGDTVTLTYHMVAEKVETKDGAKTEK
ncbi:MAG TPA: hypothetical protein VMF06_00335 [Candidatus Limnocylindria bacterium]|jgi:hypothetical protein|nr:hypothetical protein [Candidatus Limnocylindria bacterium]